MRLKGVYQQNSKDCGIACLLTIIEYYNGKNTFENIRYLTKCDTSGITALNLINASKSLGFKSRGLKCKLEDLKKLTMPLICHVTLENGYNHYIVIEKIKGKKIFIFDPDKGKKRYTDIEFLKIWNGVVIELIPYRQLDKIENNKINLIKKIIFENKYLYFAILLLCFIFIFLTIISNYYFKTIIDSKNTLFIFIIFSILILLKEIENYFKDCLIVKLENNINKFLNITTHNKLLSLPYYYFNSRTIGDIITKIHDLEYVKEFILKLILLLPIDTILLIATTIILLNINKTLFLIFLPTSLIYVLIISLFNKKSREMIRTNQENNSINNETLVENIKNITTIKNLNIENKKSNEYKIKYNKYLSDKKIYEKFYLKESLIKNLFLLIGINLILYVGVTYIKANIIKISDLILFNSLMLYFIDALKDICSLNPLIKNGKNAIKRILEIYSFKDKNIEDKKINKFDIEFKNLTFSYDDLNNVLENINIKIKDKEKVAVIGKSGSGKSTLFKLLNKTYEPQENSIYIDNIDIRNIKTEDYITYVSQEEMLFNDTLYNNLFLNNDIKNLEEILKVTKFDEVMKNKKISMDSIIFENGENLSKGEKQKLIISRILLKNSNILILDESLNGIEEKEEVEILKNIINKFKDKTIIYITHRKKCIKLFNKTINLGGI